MAGALLSVRESADVLGRSPAFVRSLMAEGLVSYRQISGRYYVTRDDLDAWITQAPVAQSSTFIPKLPKTRRHRVKV